MINRPDTIAFLDHDYLSQQLVAYHFSKNCGKLESRQRKDNKTILETIKRNTCIDRKTKRSQNRSLCNSVEAFLNAKNDH